MSNKVREIECVWEREGAIMTNWSQYEFEHLGSVRCFSCEINVRLSKVCAWLFRCKGWRTSKYYPLMVLVSSEGTLILPRNLIGIIWKYRKNFRLSGRALYKNVGRRRTHRFHFRLYGPFGWRYMCSCVCDMILKFSKFIFPPKIIYSIKV